MNDRQKLTVLSINSVNYGSTGNIMLDISKTARDENIDAYIACAGSGLNRRRSLDKQLFIGNRVGRKVHALLAAMTGFHGFYSIGQTHLFLKQVSRLNPDIIHLHNLHGSYVNIRLLFSYLKKKKIPVVWTFHDCWAMTGRCAHFASVGCNKWKTGCHQCPIPKNVYPRSYIDQSKLSWTLKKKWLTNVDNLTIVTPSRWLAGIVGQSYFGNYPVQVINNGIDLDVFKPIQNGFRTSHQIEDKFIVLGVAFNWSKRKGLDVFVELSKRLDERFKIVLVGTNDEVDKQIPDGIISIHLTQSVREMAEIYSCANVFVNPTREDTFPTTNIEALACGTPVITFRTGGSVEIPSSTTGVVVEYNDIDNMEREIIRVCVENAYSAEACQERARTFDKRQKNKEYVDLYWSISNSLGCTSRE